MIKGGARIMTSRTAHHEADCDAALTAGEADLACGREVAPRPFVLDQLERAEEAAAARFADQRVIGEAGERSREMIAKRPTRALV